jgi:AcrR family transcriptional regulator
MGRWQPDAPGRLANAALELYNERGFEQTTVAEIAERAGLTERTFFRHFADKREVLFAGGTGLQDLMLEALLRAPDSATPTEAVACALLATCDMFEERREFARRRQAVIAANAELQERELVKMASLAKAVAEGLRERGVKSPAATLIAEAGIAVFRVAFERWTSPSNRRRLRGLIEDSLDQLRNVFLATAPPRR